VGTELALRSDAIALGEVMHKSGMFPDTKNAAVAAVKILAGQEYGLGPAASMSGIDVIDNKPVPRAIVILARVKSSGRYNYRVKEWTNQACELEFSEKVDGKWQVLSPTSRFTMEDAKRAGLAGRQVWQKYPRNMLLWRCGVNGARLHCPEAFGGMPILSAEEAADEANVDIEIVGGVPEEPVKVENVATKWQPSPAQITELRELYVKTGWHEQDKNHERLRLQLAATGAGNAGELAVCLAALTEDQFAGVRDALVEAAVTETFDAKAES